MKEVVKVKANDQEMIADAAVDSRGASSCDEVLVEAMENTAVLDAVHQAGAAVGLKAGGDTTQVAAVSSLYGRLDPPAATYAWYFDRRYVRRSPATTIQAAVRGHTVRQWLKRAYTQKRVYTCSRPGTGIGCGVCTWCWYYK